MNEELRQRIYNLFSDEIQGGCISDMEQILDVAIEDGYLTQGEYDANELAIATLFDDYWFTCTQCGWTMPSSEMADDGEWRCQQCAEEY